MTFWSHQDASLAFLEDAGYAVLRFAPFGGGETTANAPPGFLGLQGPVTLPATRVVFRACAAPQAFTPTGPREQCCTRGAEIGLATGVDLSLLFSSGVGPLVLSQATWTRVVATPGHGARHGRRRRLLYVATWPTPIAASWTTIPRFALVDGFEPPSTGDEGPCVDLGRARRIEWVAVQQQAHPALAACVEPCDTDPLETNDALNSAAYIELGGAIPVAVVADDEELYLQALRFDIRPEGPDIDGVVGAGALGAARVEVDYLSNPNRSIFSCEAGAARAACYAAARCTHLPNHDDQHLWASSVGELATDLPAACALSGCCTRRRERLARSPKSACTMAHRMRYAVAAGLAAFLSLSLAAAPAEARVRLSITEFEIAGGDSPALSNQLQDGFVLGLVRDGIQVIDTADLARRLEGHPELQYRDALLLASRPSETARGRRRRRACACRGRRQQLQDLWPASSRPRARRPRPSP